MTVHSFHSVPSEQSLIRQESAFLAHEAEKYHGGAASNPEEPSECDRCGKSFEFDFDIEHWIIPVPLESGEAYCSESCRLIDALDCRWRLIRAIRADIATGDTHNARADAIALARHTNALFGSGAVDQILQGAVDETL